MKLHTHLKHRFVHHIPEVLVPGVIYISIDYATAIHSCCCGCGEEVVTPFTPAGWHLAFDGETVSLWPSVGNWNSACRSQYLIQQSQVVEAEPWRDDLLLPGSPRAHTARALNAEKEVVGEGECRNVPPHSSYWSPSRLWSELRAWAQGWKGKGRRNR
jgi:hypothetical protein